MISVNNIVNCLSQHLTAQWHINNSEN